MTQEHLVFVPSCNPANQNQKLSKLNFITNCAKANHSSLFFNICANVIASDGNTIYCKTFIFDAINVEAKVQDAKCQRIVIQRLTEKSC